MLVDLVQLRGRCSKAGAVVLKERWQWGWQQWGSSGGGEWAGVQKGWVREVVDLAGLRGRCGTAGAMGTGRGWGQQQR